MELFTTEIDQIIGCGQRNGAKYFLVRYKNATQNELLDWESAKEYSLQVMQYFGSRLVWDPVRNIIDPESDGNLIEQLDQNEAQSNTVPLDEQPSTSTANTSRSDYPAALNDIEYDN